MGLEPARPGTGLVRARPASFRDSDPDAEGDPHQTDGDSRRSSDRNVGAEQSRASDSDVGARKGSTAHRDRPGHHCRDYGADGFDIDSDGDAITNRATDCHAIAYRAADSNRHPITDGNTCSNRDAVANGNA